MTVVREINTKLHACSIETIGADDLIACGTYELNEQQDVRKGEILLLDIKRNEPVIATIDCDSGVLDMKVVKNRLVAAMSNGSLDVYSINGSSDSRKMVSLLKECSAHKEEEGLFLALDIDQRLSGDCWSCDTYIVVSTQQGSILLYVHKSSNENELSTVVHNLNLVCSVNNAHILMGEVVPVWIVSFDPHTRNRLISGGDDCVLKLWNITMNDDGSSKNVDSSKEMKSTPLSLTLNSAVAKKHGAGVTSAQWHPIYPHIFATGSYDEYIRIWDCRQLAKPILEIHAGGGVWRIKWHVIISSSNSTNYNNHITNTNSNIEIENSCIMKKSELCNDTTKGSEVYHHYLIAACMQGGSGIFKIGRRTNDKQESSDLLTITKEIEEVSKLDLCVSENNDENRSNMEGFTLLDSYIHNGARLDYIGEEQQPPNHLAYGIDMISCCPCVGDNLITDIIGDGNCRDKTNTVEKTESVLDSNFEFTFSSCSFYENLIQVCQLSIDEYDMLKDMGCDNLQVSDDSVHWLGLKAKQDKNNSLVAVNGSVFEIEMTPTDLFTEDSVVFDEEFRQFDISYDGSNCSSSDMASKDFQDPITAPSHSILPDAESELQEMLISATDPVGKFLRQRNISAHQAVALGLHHMLLKAPKTPRQRYGPRHELSAAERSALSKTRNREHARATRQRKKVFDQVTRLLEQKIGGTVSSRTTSRQLSINNNINKINDEVGKSSLLQQEDRNVRAKIDVFHNEEFFR